MGSLGAPRSRPAQTALPPPQMTCIHEKLSLAIINSELHTPGLGRIVNQSNGWVNHFP